MRCVWGGGEMYCRCCCCYLFYSALIFLFVSFFIRFLLDYLRGNIIIELLVKLGIDNCYSQVMNEWPPLGIAVLLSP
jgi:hypothetical protein